MTFIAIPCWRSPWIWLFPDWNKQNQNILVRQ